MTIGFLRPVGAVADVSELEYISAIAQTDLASVRTNGSITAEDIKYFLLSRYGIIIDEDDVKSKIIRGLGGGDEEEDDTIDLMEIVATLLIPTLIKASMEQVPEGLVKPHEELIPFVLSMILHDTNNNNKNPKLTPDLIRNILRSYGESELADNDQLIQEMFEAAQGPTNQNDHHDGERTASVLDEQTFKNALTQDVTLYDPCCEANFTTNMEDVFLASPPTLAPTNDTNATDEEQILVNEENIVTASDLKRKRVLFSAFDSTAGTYRSKIMIVLLWTVFVIFYFGFVPNETTTVCVDTSYGEKWNAEAFDAMECEIVISIIIWLSRFTLASSFGLIFVGLGSIGNTTHIRSFAVPLIGAVATLIIAFGGEIATRVLGLESENVAAELAYLGVIFYFLGAVIALFHVMHSLAILLPQAWIKQNRFVERFFSSGYLRNVVNLKKSAAFKLNKMVNNALALAQDKQEDSVLVTHFGQGLLNFSKDRQVEWSSSTLETLNKMWTGELYSKEGISLSVRLVSSNVSQFIVVVFLVIRGVRMAHYLHENYSIDAAKESLEGYTKYFFDYIANSDEIAALVTNSSVLLSGYLANATGSSDIAAAQCQNYTTSLADLGLAACEFSNDTLIPTCNKDLVSTTEYLCSLSQTYTTYLVDQVNSTVDSPILGALQSNEGIQTNLALLAATGFDIEGMFVVAADALQKAGESTIEKLYPTDDYMVFIPFLVGIGAAGLSALSLAVTYIPSVTSTTLKLRTGVIPSLRDVEFNQYRTSADQVTILAGSLVWGSFLSSILVGGSAGITVFFFLWQASIPIVQKILAIVIGLIVVVLIKTIMVASCRCAFYKAFYRKKPAAVNLSNLALEAANFALSSGFVFLRMIKLLVTAALYVGRIDTWFLAPGVGKYKTFELDNYPRIFLKDILAHEAHRHPYIDLLGVVYLMKLRYSENFGKRAGSTWRLIFVYGLMPWMHKYRILATLENQVDIFASAMINGGMKKGGRKGSKKPFFPNKSKELDSASEKIEAEDEKTEKPLQSLMSTGNLNRQRVGTTKHEIEAQNIHLSEEVATLRERIAQLEAKYGI